jgi:redox-sensing transcriptional repressor
VAVPAWEAQNAADRLVRAGVTGIINFAPIRLHVPEQVIIRDVCFICELTVLSYLIQEASEAANAEGTPRKMDFEPRT